MITYKIKQVSLVPDEYGKHIKVKMMSMYDKGKFVKHIKLDEKALDILNTSLVLPEVPHGNSV